MASVHKDVDQKDIRSLDFRPSYVNRQLASRSRPMSTDAPGETISTATASIARHFGAGPSPRWPKVIQSEKIGTERASPPSSDELASITPMEGIPIQATIDAPIAVTRAPVSTSP